MPRPIQVFANAALWLLTSAIGLHAHAQAPSAAADPAAPGSGWVAETSDEDGIAVYTRDGPGRLRTFLGVARLRTTLGALVAVLLDRDNAHRWSYKVERVTTLPGGTRTDGHARMVSSSAPLIDRRETIYAWRVRRDLSTHAVIIHAENKPLLLPPSPGLVRVPDMASTWQFLPMPDGNIEVRFSGYADLGGNLSDGMALGVVNAVLGEAPLRTLQGLKRMVAQAPYRDAALPEVPVVGVP